VDVYDCLSLSLAQTKPEVVNQLSLDPTTSSGTDRTGWKQIGDASMTCMWTSPG